MELKYDGLSVIKVWAGLSKAGLRLPRVNLKFDFRSESLESKFSYFFFSTI